MDSSTSLTTPDATSLSPLLSGGSSQSLIPEAYKLPLTVAFIVLNLLGLVLLLVWLATLLRTWKVQSAVLAMQKDVAALKVQLASTPEVPTRDVPQPLPANRTIAEEPSPSTGNEHDPRIV